MKPLADRALKPHAFSAPDKIALATDLADLDYLAPYAVAQAKAYGATLTLIHVIPPSESLAFDASAMPYADAVAMEAEAKQILEETAVMARSSGVACDFLVRHGSPGDIVRDIVHKIGATRLIMGTHGRRNLKRLILGSVANEIIRYINIPVCAIGPNAHATPPHGTPQKILHPVSLAEGCEPSAQVAIEIAQFHKVPITLLHVLVRDLHREYDSNRFVERVLSQLQMLVPEDAPLWTHSTLRTEVGEAVEQILTVANEMNADLIVLGVGSEASFWPLDGDNTAYEIIAQARCPVLTVRRSVPVGMPADKHKSTVPLVIG